MRIGITTDIRHSIFSAGHPNACLSVAEMFINSGHDVVFLHQQEDKQWWDDVLTLKDTAPKCILMSEFLKESSQLDLLIEIAFFVSPIMRHKLAKYCVWYNRKPGLFSDLESSVYGSKPEGRDLEGITEIWTADIFTKEDDIVYLQTLYPKIPVHLVPWTWTPSIVESHRKELKSPVWLNNYQASPVNGPWSLHVCETNKTNTSSCTLPLVIIKHAIESKPFPVSNIYLHNTELLEKNAFFNENILVHSRFTDISYNLVGRQRCIDWVYDSKSVVISHNRFVSMKVANLEAAWVGLPVIHNNEFLRDIGHGLEKLYYKSNSITGAAEAMHKVVFETGNVPYLNSLESLTEVRKAILLRVCPDIHANTWNNAALRIASSFTIPQNPVVKAKPVKLDKFTMLFTDMWSMFNEQHNMFTLAMQTALEVTNEHVIVKGYSPDTLPVGEEPDIVIFGPFGDVYKSLPDAWPKVHFTGENTLPVINPSVKLNIGFNRTTDKDYLRMPLWMFEIDWFGADLEKIQNPLPLPIDSCTTTVDDYQERKKFCAFVVTNPSNTIRNEAFSALHSYKHVDSAGQLFNNIGEDIFAGPGGGGGELKKHEFLKGYRFCIAYENNSAPGYTTEKLLHAKAAGCVPIYWGDPSVDADFDSKGFINMTGCSDKETLIQRVKEVEESADLWKQYASVPALTTEKRDLVRRTFSDMASRFLSIANKNTDIPPLLGAATSSEANKLRINREPVVVQAIPTPQQGIPSDPLLVTGATQRFWPCVMKWLDSLKVHRAGLPGLTARVYVGADVSDQSIQMTSSTYSDFAEFIRYPVEAPGFPDFWEPQHYAWKVWIYTTVVNDPKVNGRLVFYMDSASILVRWPIHWIQQAVTTGVSFLDDIRQKNEQWCHSTFCDALTVTEQERDSNQIAACLILFVAGHPLAISLFSSAYKWAQVRDVIVGEKWEKSLTTGKIRGHRHDQSILSILSQRLNIPRVPIDTVYCDKSARATFHSGKSVYVYRENYKAHEPYLPGIDEIFAVNLDRREDRRKTFIEHHPELKGTLRRLPAYDGRKLTLGPYLARLFKPNDFHWKKAVMGCALSHLKLLHMLVNEPSDINAYCILEDDCRLEKGWQSKWIRVYPSLPDDWDCVYLGGVLPPNKPGFESALERIAPGLARIAPNQIFGQAKATRYFHFCTYAYVISRAGAKKIIKSIFDKDGYWTSADHMMCNPVDIMNNYVIDPLVAGASQDDDPIYQTADFNNFSRVDNFDSDLWNNDERFTLEEVLREQEKEAPLDIASTLSEVDGVSVEIPKEPVNTVVNKAPRFISLDVCEIVGEGFYELPWLQELFQGVKVSIEPVSTDAPLDTDRPIIVVVRRPLWKEQMIWLTNICNRNIKFKIIHLSDEFKLDPIHFYNLSNVTGVIRNYYRDDLPKDPKVLVIPLGYHWPASAVKGKFLDRKDMWSFAGTNWVNRQVLMAPLEAIKPNTVHWYSEWRDPTNLSETDYLDLMSQTMCVPCPRGKNVETYRFYEALENGCIPIFVDDPDTAQWMQQFNMGDKSMNFFRIPNWTAAAEVIQHFKENPDKMLEYRDMILKGWSVFKTSLKKKLCALMI